MHNCVLGEGESGCVVYNICAICVLLWWMLASLHAPWLLRFKVQVLVDGEKIGGNLTTWSSVQLDIDNTGVRHFAAGGGV